MLICLNPNLNVLINRNNIFALNSSLICIQWNLKFYAFIDVNKLISSL